MPWWTLVPTLIGLAACASAPDPGDPAYTEVDARLAGQPPAVRAFVYRTMGCNHWAGEYAYDAERGRDIDRALRRLRCPDLEGDERRLAKRYPQSAALLLESRDWQE